MKIVITGAGIVSSLGFGQQATLHALLHEQSGIAAPVYLPTAHREHPVGEVQASNESLAVRLGITETLSRTALLGVAAVREALSQADIRELSQTAFISGTTVGGMDHTERYWREKESCASSVVELHTAGSSTEQIARQVGTFAMTGTISTACSSALNAVIAACNLIRSGQYRQVVAGGAESLSLFHFNGFRALQILSDEVCRPFSANRKGLNLGEGAAYVIVETEDSALQRKAPILAYINGYGNACDAFHQTASSDDGEGAFLAMQQALSMAHIEPSQVDYINAHGTGTPNNDSSETAAMRRLFGEIVPPFSSTKAFTGHATSAAGGIELVISLLALQHGFIPANLHFQQAMENGMTPVRQTEQKILRNVLCNSFGFGGNDSSLLLAKEGQDLSAALEDNTYTVLADVIATEEADYKRYISPMQARRLSPMLRQLVFAAYSALEQAQDIVPDAIITGTDLGCIAYSVSLLNQLTEEGEDALSPTLFMQSTHNTPSSLIAILTRNHGYNCTWSHGARSYEQALHDAQTQIQLGLIRSALVLGFEENDDTWQSLEHSAGISHTPQARATLIVNLKSPLSNVK